MELHVSEPFGISRFYFYVLNGNAPLRLSEPLLAASKPEPWNKQKPHKHYQKLLICSEAQWNQALPLPVCDWSPASARCSSARPVRSEAPAAAPSPPPDPPWASGRSSPETKIGNGRIETQLDKLKLCCEGSSASSSLLRSLWLHSASPVCPAWQQLSRWACRSEGNLWGATQNKIWRQHGLPLIMWRPGWCFYSITFIDLRWIPILFPRCWSWIYLPFVCHSPFVQQLQFEASGRHHPPEASVVPVDWQREALIKF